MSDDRIDRLEAHAAAVAAEFDEHRLPDGFSEVNPVVHTADRERPTLIVHVDHEDAATLADEVEAFLVDRGATTQREQYAPDDVRVLATVE